MLVFNILNSDTCARSSFLLHPPLLSLLMSLVESVPFREWGTRYDSLSTSPSPSTTASSLSRNPPTTTCTSAANSSLLPPRVVTPIEFRSQGEKPSNDASVFVGSLPTNVDHVELGARLKDHLSIYVDVNVVRIIRDRRGGVCAFAQCNDSATAARLLQTVRSLPPQNFLGRYLRFEPARSQRTLWISYRKPVEVIYDTDHGRPNPSLNPTSRFVGFDLPKVMRICRAPGSRRINILYNTQAFHPDGDTNISLSHSLQEQDAAESDLSGVGLVLSPLQFDSQTLRRIASSFGPLESFDLRQPEPTDDRPEYQTYPYPHNADRSESMDPGCWEIKWENRNDCLSALATLCSVPHLTVTWPNQQHALIPRRNGLFNRSHQVRDHEAFRHPGLPVQPRHGENDNTPNQIISSLDSPSPWKDSAGTAAAAVDPQPSSECLSPLNNDDLPITADGWTIIDAGSNTNLHVSPTFQDIPVSEQLRVSRSHPCDDEVLRMGGVPSSQSSKRVEWSEVVSDSAAQPRDEVATLSPASPLHTPARGGNPQSPPPGSVTALSTPFVESLASPFTPRSPRLVHPHASSSFNFYDTFAIPPAPQWSEARLRRSAGPCDENIDDNSRNVPDSTTIFVGGLEVHGRCTWDEQRLRRVFGQYGDITEVKLVRPAHRKSAFAFVTYRDNRSSSRAVLAEHDRIYDGRHIRVQLRDSAVHRVHRPKSNFKSGEIRPFSPRHQIGPRINSSLIDTIPRFQNGTGPTIPPPCEESVPTLPHSPDGVPSVQPDARGQVPENSCVPSIPSQVSSAMVSGVPPMAYPPPPHPTFYAPAPWFMHPYPYVPPPHIVPGYPPIPTPPVVSANEAGRPAPPHTMYQPIPHYSLYPLSLPPIPPNRQQHVELANLTERRAPLQPTGFIESEQGLIPVYAPEALGEYMANTNSHQSTAEPGGGHSASHPPKAVLEARSRTMYAMYPQHQYHPTFVSDRMMPAPSQFPNALNMMPVGTGFNWYHETTNSEYLAQEVFRVAGPAAQRVEIHPGIPTVQSPRCQAYSERGFGVSRRRGQIDRSAFARISRANNHPGAYTTRRRGYFKHTGGTVSMSAVTDQTAETSQSDVASVADPVVRASTSSPAVFDLTPTSPTGGTQM